MKTRLTMERQTNGNHALVGGGGKSMETRLQWGKVKLKLGLSWAKFNANKASDGKIN